MNKIGPAQIKGSIDMDARTYLESWQRKEDWKFNKKMQHYVLENIFSKNRIPRDLFDIAREYIRGLQGNARSRLLEAAQKNILEKRRFKRSKKIVKTLKKTENKSKK